MARSVVLGNGTILVDLDAHGRVRDFYFPYVGQENHVNGEIHHIGIWVDRTFCWLGSDEFTKELYYEKETLVTNIIATNKSLGIQLNFSDVVCHDVNIFIRKVTVHNLLDTNRNIRLFFHQRFSCYESNIGDTVFYNPFLKAIVHYKGKRYFLTNGMFYDEEGGHSFDQYATGLSGEFGKEGTYKDAEDGELSQHPIEHGSVDSTIRFCCNVPAQGSKAIYYWICVGKDLGEVSRLDGFIRKTRPEILIEKTRTHWNTWVNRTPFNYYKLSESVIEQFKRSLLVLQSHLDKSGSIIASSDSDILFRRRDTYSYMWPRDGALIVRALDRAGYFELTESFFEFCFNAVTPFGYLFHKYRPDGSFGSTWHSWIHEGRPQLPIQEDEIGLVLDALWKHYEMYQEKEHAKEIYKTFIADVTDFMLDFIDERTGLPKESHDLWEEKLGIHTFTCSTVYAGLDAAAKFEAEFGTPQRAEQCLIACERIKQGIIEQLYDEKLGRFIKGLYYHEGKLQRDTTHDASNFYGVYQFGVLPVDDPRITSSFERFLEELKIDNVSGGFVRYKNDPYLRETCSPIGNAWFIPTLWLAEYYITRAQSFDDLQPAIDIFEWVTQWALSTGVLSEQLDPCTGKQISVAPLTWSHAGLIIAITKYLEKLDELEICEMCYPMTPKNRSKSK